MMKLLMMIPVLFFSSCLHLYYLPIQLDIYLEQVNKSKNTTFLNVTLQDWHKRFSRDSLIATVNNKKWTKCIIVEIGNTNERSYSAICVGQTKDNKFEKCLAFESNINCSKSNNAEYENLKNEINGTQNNFEVLDGNMVIVTKIINDQYSVKIFYGQNDYIYKLISK